MGRKFLLILTFAAMLVILACDTGSFIAFGNPTATPSRTPRPTFTPRPSPTPEQSPTPVRTATPVASPTPSPTQRVVPTVRPVTPKPPTPTPIPAPTFPIRVTDAYPCPQSPESQVYEVLMRINRSTPPHIFLGDYVIELRSPDGSFRKTTVTVPDGQQYMSMLGGANCRVANFWPYNAKIDAAELRGSASEYLVRVIKSQNDATPLSAEVKVTFKQPIRWIIYYATP